MNNKELLDRLMEDSKIKRSGLTPEVIKYIIKTYNDTSLDMLLENGHVELGNDMILEVVQLTDRVHVLRGTPYKSNRKYKLKLTMEDTVYKKIEEYYDRLKQEIE